MVEEAAVADSASLRMTQFSATRTEAVGSTTGGDGGDEAMLGEED